MSVFWLIVVIVVFALLIGWWMTAGRAAPPVNRPALEAAPQVPVIPPVMADPAIAPAPVMPTPEPAVVPMPAPPADVVPSGTLTDNLLLIKGVGPALEKLLRSLGVDRFDQIATWTPADVERIDARLGRFKGRIERDAWIDQAGLLARGDTAAFEAKFGKL